MQDRHIGEVRVTRIEEQMGPGFPAKDFFPEFEPETFKSHEHWMAPGYYQPESGRLVRSIHSREHRDPPRRRHEVLAVGNQHAPFSGRRLSAEPEVT